MDAVDALGRVLYLVESLSTLTDEDREAIQTVKDEIFVQMGEDEDEDEG